VKEKIAIATIPVRIPVAHDLTAAVEYVHSGGENLIATIPAEIKSPGIIKNRNTGDISARITPAYDATGPMRVRDAGISTPKKIPDKTRGRMQRPSGECLTGTFMSSVSGSFLIKVLCESERESTTRTTIREPNPRAFLYPYDYIMVKD